MPYENYADNQQFNDGQFKGRVLKSLDRQLSIFKHIVNATRMIHKASLRSGDVTEEDMNAKMAALSLQRQPGETALQCLQRLRAENNDVLRHIPRRNMIANEGSVRPLNTLCEYGGGFNWMPVLNQQDPVAPLIDSHPNAWMVLAQYNAHPFRSPPHGLYVKNISGVERLQVVNRYKLSGQNEVTETLADVPLQRGSHGLQTEYKNAGGELGGIVKVWLDGTQIVNYSGRTGCHDNTYGSFFGFGAYGWPYAPATEKVDVWYENFYERVKAA